VGNAIGVIANASSGKDIRRLVSYATVIDNQEKINIVKRIILAAQSFGIDTLYFMPDSFNIGMRAAIDLRDERVLRACCETFEMPCRDCAGDSTEAAARMEALGVGCIIVLGGDGTSRAVAKGIRDTPLLPVSTGTNNVYPTMVEGTVAGMAAAFTATSNSPKDVCTKDKRIELHVNGQLTDIALVDAAMTSDRYIGSRAVWNIACISEIIVTRCHPATIGFSSVPGCVTVVRPEDDFGYILKADPEGRAVCAPVAAGMPQRFGIGAHRPLPLNEDYVYELKETCMAALDGERELLLRQGSSVVFRITREGPWRVDIKGALERACREGLFYCN
jgi:predicted polyphosphate/ATP-dependent NAD kinase